MDTEKDVSSQKYNPFDHRDVKKPNSDIRSLANLLKASLGSGILAIPLAFANAGWGVGIVATIIIAIICAHCVDIFVSVSRGCCVALQKPVLNYADTCEAAFSIGPKRFRSLSRFAKAVITTHGDFPSTISINTINTKCKDNIEDYDPFQNRKLEHPNSDVRSFANLLKSSLGSGILAMPAAFKNAGTVVGIFGTIILGYICTHCVFLLVKTSQEVSRVSRVPSLGYAETVEAVFATGPPRLRGMAKAMRIFVDWAMAITILGACAVYVILLVDSVKQIVDHFNPDNGITTTMYCLMFLAPVLIFTQIKNLKYLAPFSGFANVLLVLTFLICLYYICAEFPTFDSRPMSVDIGRLPLYIGTVIFAMEGIGVVLPVENTMAKPQHFLGCPGVLNLTMSIVVLLYMIMGMLGYLRYGETAEGSITLNLPTEEIPALLAKVMIIFAIFFTYTLQFYVPMEIVWRNVRGRVPQRYHNHGQAVMRAVFSTLTVIAAASLPRLEQVIGLEGAFFYSFLGLITPSLLDLIFRWDRDLGKYNYHLIKDVVLAVFGSFVLVTGVSQSIREIIKTSGDA